jgi:hypothetical protein
MSTWKPPVTDPANIPFKQARWFTATTGRVRRKIVIHSMEAPEKGKTAENIAGYFAGLPSNRKASAHYCIDNDSIVQCVQTRDVAFAAPGANNDGIQLELAGYARQTREEWLDPYSTAVLKNAAWLCGVVLVPKINIPVVFIPAATMKRNPRAEGFTTHNEVSQAFKQSSHWDPGPGFPFDLFLSWVNAARRGELH